jgi:preprotein translocase subunit YajC
LSHKRIYLIGAFLIASLLKSLSSAWAQAAPGGQAQGPAQTFSFFLPLILVFAIFYFLIIRPQQKQAKQRQAMISAVKKGDQVITVGGIHGRITGVTDTILTLEIADNCKVKVERSSIQSVAPSKESDE